MTLQVWRDGAKRTAVLPVEGHKSFGSCPEANGQTAALFATASRRGQSRRASIGQLCLGLAWLGLWGPLVFRVIEPWFLPLETALGYLPLSMFGSFSLVGNAILSDAGHGVVVNPACSVFANTIRTTFIWLAMVKVQGTEFRSWHFRVLALSLVTVFLLNTSRLGLMAYSYNGYLFWHESYGASIMSWTMLATVIGLFCFGLRREGSS